MSSIKVLYEDNHIIAVYKPAGVLTQADKTGDVSLFDMVKDYIRIKKGKGSILDLGNAKPRSETAVSTTGVFLGLVHRLDRPVAGIILFAKTSKGAARLSEQFRNNEIQKEYSAIVIGKPKKDRGVIKSYLLKDEKSKKAVILDNEQKGGQFAELGYEMISSNRKYSLLKILPKTGRFHQIRAQLASIGCHILGDVKYGADSALPDKSICLAETSITFKLATKEEYKTISIKIPGSWEKYLF